MKLDESFALHPGAQELKDAAGDSYAPMTAELQWECGEAETLGDVLIMA